MAWCVRGARGCVARWLPVLVVRSRLRRHGLGGCSPASCATVRRGPALWSERVLLLWGRGQRGTPGVNGGARNRMHMTSASALEPGDLLEREVIPAPNQPPRADGLNWRIPDGPREVRCCGARGRIPARVTVTVSLSSQFLRSPCSTQNKLTSNPMPGRSARTSPRLLPCDVPSSYTCLNSKRSPARQVDREARAASSNGDVQGPDMIANLAPKRNVRWKSRVPQ